MLRLCDTHGLHSAMAYVHNCLLEYRKPVLDMLWTIASSSSSSSSSSPVGGCDDSTALTTSDGTHEARAAFSGGGSAAAAAAATADTAASCAYATYPAGAVRVGYKLLVYLRCLLTGHAFPPGGFGLIVKCVKSGWWRVPLYPVSKWILFLN